MFNRKILGILVVLIALSAVFVVPNTTDAVQVNFACWESVCAPVGVSTHIDQQGCSVTSTCLLLVYCELVVCPDDADDWVDFHGKVSDSLF